MLYSPYEILQKLLYRSRENRVVFGVMGGLGEYFDIDPVIFRVAYTAFTFFSGFLPGMGAYILMTMVMPPRPLVVHEKSRRSKRGNKRNKRVV